MLWAAVVASGLVGGVVGGLVAHHVEDKPPKTSAKPEPAKVDNEADDGDLADRVDTIEREVAALSRAQRARGAVAGYGAVLGAGAQDGGARATADRPALESAVRSVMDDIDSERQADREARREQRRSAMAQRWGDTLAQKLSLTDEQKQKIVEILQQAMTRPPDSQADGGFTDFREQRRKAQADAEKKLAGVLDAKQLDQYHALRDSGEIGFGGGRRGGRSGD